MAISRNVDITVTSDKATLDKSLCFYKEDLGIVLNMSIINLEYNIVKISTVLNLDEFAGVEILVSKPNRKTLCVREVPVVSGKISFSITKELTDVVGDYLFQIRLLDSNGGRMTIPPCGYKVLEPIAIY